MQGELTIGKVARQAGVNIQTVRYYERRGLLRPDDYRESGYRLYSGEAVKRLRFIKNAQTLGFSLAQIAILLRLRVGPKTRCDQVRSRAEAQLRAVNEKLATLGAMKNALSGLVNACRRRRATDPCPILKALEAGGG